MKADSGLLIGFINNIYPNPSSDAYDVCSWSEQMNNLVCGSNNTALKSFANLLIQKVTPLNLGDAKSLMTCYLAFESYFLQVVNNQFQCVMIWSNACNAIDTNGYEANLYYTGTFQQDITGEIAAFLSTTEYLAINLSDYRHYVNWEADYPYNQNGLAPDLLFPDILARSQFIANLLYDALGLSYPVMSGTIITPNKYSNEYTPNVESIVLDTDIKPLYSDANILPSQFPNTYWNISNATCYPDNLWNVYRFGQMGVVDNGWPCTPVNIEVKDNGDGYYPWSHYQPCKGKATTLYYNPQNPNQTSTSYNNLCTMQFGYFSARWNWGYQFITMRNEYWLRPQYLDLAHENSTFSQDDMFFTLPGIMYAISSEIYDKVPNPTGFSWPHSNLGGFCFSNTTASTKYYYIVADVLYCDIATSSEIPPLSGGVEMWGMSSSQFNGPGGSSGYLQVYLGSELSSTSDHLGTYYRSKGDIINSTTHDPNVWVNYVNSVNISANKSYQPSAEVYYQAYSIGAVPLSFSDYNMMQVVYDGTYNIFQ
jgi:hypothetical protein